MNPTPHHTPPHPAHAPYSAPSASSAAAPGAGARGNGSAADDLPKFRYTAEFANQVEVRWQETWEAQNTFSTPNPGQPGFDASKPKFYCLDMFPYPSGAGLHVGHPEGYTATDIICRFMRMKGRNVLHPMGWDAYGLPAEQYAIQTGVHPAITTKTAIDNFRRQLKRFGFSYDWKREFGTIDPEYYKWTQWIFLKAYDSWFDPEAANGTGGKGRARPIADLVRQLESGDLRVTAGGDLVHVGMAANNPILGGEPAGTLRWHELKPEQRRQVIDDQRLAYLAESTVNWCPALGTVLANDEVIDGRSERGGHPVLRKPLKQWMFRITAYAQRLLEDLALVDWPESTKTMQSEWIGRSEGAEIDFILEHTQDEFLRVFTTRPDTLFGATYMVVAPEHPLVKRAMNQPQPGADAAAIAAYVKQTQGKAEVDRMTDAGGKEKTGVFTGFFCVNPATGEKIPVWTADYVLMSYGHGAIMAVPAHDERDFEFAQKFALPIVDVVYTHVEAAMRHFALHATLEEQAPERWKHVLADMLGVVTSTNADMDQLHQALMTVRTRRAVPPVHAAPDAAKRGAISGEWLETIEGLKFTGFAGFKAIFGQKRFRAHAGSAGSAPGLAVNSHNKEVSLDGMATDEAKKRICAWLSKTGRGNARVNFRLRDWAFSRQRYWGEPFPIVYDQKGNHYPVGEKALPVELPALADYSPVESEDPQPLLAKATQWMNTTAGAAGVDPNVLPPETPVRRETNTMPGSAGSSWYFLRYADARNGERFVGREAEAYWMGTGAKGAEKARAGVDLYIGGSEHAVGHLLYSRFWQKILFDLGEVSVPEPFGKLFHQGLITSFAFQRADKTIIAVDEVKEVSEGKFVESANGNPVTPVVTKMSKRYKNVVNPDDVIAELGADTFRIYEMYMGPLAASKPWNTKDAVGIFRFLQRAWRLAVDEQTGELKLLDAPKPGVDKHLHRMIAKVDQDIPRLAFNTGIAAMIEFVNEATSAGGITREQLRLFTLALAPFAPHIAEELWAKMGEGKSLAYESFPVPDAAMLVDDVIEIPVQIAGKVRGRIMVPAAIAGDKAAIERIALEDPAIKGLLEGKKIQKVIVVPGKMVNVVAV